MILAISDAVWLAAIGVLAMAVKEYFDRSRARDAAKEVKDVKENLEHNTTSTAEKLSEIAQVGEKTHTLVNSNMGIQLSAVAELARWKADREPTNVQYREDANRAEQMLREHEGKQAKVDSQPGKGK